MRYSSSMLAAIFISFFTFLGMSFLISAPEYRKSVEFDTIEFSKIRDQKPVNTTRPEPKHEKPVKKAVKHPPTKPNVDVVTPTEPPVISLPTGKANLKNALLDYKDFPKFKVGDDYGTPGTGSELQELIPIQPAYPAKALRGKIEGWVKVEFVVNEFGMVSSAKVVDAKPKHIFDNATLRAIYKSKFKPLMVDGKAMPQTAVQTIEFKLQK